jgi:hypothetical protein
MMRRKKYEQWDKLMTVKNKKIQKQRKILQTTKKRGLILRKIQ